MKRKLQMIKLLLSVFMYWSKHPEYRFGQFVINHCGGIDPWYEPDTRFGEYFKHLC